MSKYRFKTREEFIRDGLWDEEDNCPYYWNPDGEMNEYLGIDIPDECIVYCDKNESFCFDNWLFINTDYVLKEQQEYFDDLSQHIGRYIRALVDNPYGGSGVKKGDVGKIIDKDRVDFPDFKRYHCTCALDKYSLGTKYELLPEDYSPEQEIKEPSVEFIPGKWYNFTTMKGKYSLYVKVSSVTDKNLFFANGESISNGYFGKAYSIDVELIENPRLVEDLSEIQEYLPEGHPDKVKNFKLKIGKWYKFLNGSLKFGRYEKIHNSGNRIKFSEVITSTGIYDNKSTHVDFTSNIEPLEDLSEIQKYLPNEHPDKIIKQKFEIGKWYKWYQKNHGNYHYGKVERITTETHTVVMTPWIIQGSNYKNSGTFDLSKAEQIQEISVEDIQEFLPNSHPDKITSDVFKEGEYIVITDKFDSWTKDFVSNHIYKQRKDSTYLQPEYDSLLSKTNGWIKYKLKYPNWRYATQEEIDEYERRGKPYDVTELQKKETFPEYGCVVITDNPINLVNYLQNSNRKPASNNNYDKGKTILAWNNGSYWFCSVGSSKTKYSKDYIETIMGQSIYSYKLLKTKKELSMEEIQEECKRRFPIGCTFIAVGSCMHRILKEDSYTYKIVDKQIWAHSGGGWLYEDGKWAELVSLPEEEPKKFEKPDILYHSKSTIKVVKKTTKIKKPLAINSISINAIKK